MKRTLLHLASLAAMTAMLAAHPAAAQDVAIVNARIIVGNGKVIDSGTLIVHGGKIASVSAGTADTGKMQTIDAHGMTAMPGYIDAHKHINSGPNEKAPSRFGTTSKAAKSTGRASFRRAGCRPRSRAPSRSRVGAAGSATSRRTRLAPASGNWRPWGSSGPVRSR
jgi:imidazolonepropionase-like amidohydrolase